MLLLPHLCAGDQSAAVAAMAEAVGLAKKFDAPAASLSGGMKRKLQVRQLTVDVSVLHNYNITSLQLSI